jgi:hypothetical protein
LNVTRQTALDVRVTRICAFSVFASIGASSDSVLVQVGSV